MTDKHAHIIISVLFAAALLGSCATRKTFSTNYYHENEDTLVQIEQAYRALYNIKPFSVEFTDRSFNNITLEIKTDSIKYIYAFNLNEPRLQDTLSKYQIPRGSLMNMIDKMRAIKCIWINMMDYYTNGQKNTLVFMSIRNVAVHLPFTSEKYYILTFYSQPQYYDSEGQLLVGRNLRRLRRINGEIFKRITDKVCYTISGTFR